MSYTPIWKQYGYDVTDSNRTSQHLCDLSLLSKYYRYNTITTPINEPYCSIIINEQNEKSIIYFATNDNKIHALQTNEPSVTPKYSELWTSVALTTVFSMTLSQNGEYLIVLGYNKLWLINCDDGSLLDTVSSTGICQQSIKTGLVNNSFYVIGEGVGSGYTQLHRYTISGTTLSLVYGLNLSYTGAASYGFITIDPTLRNDGNDYYNVYVTTYSGPTLLTKNKDYTNPLLTPVASSPIYLNDLGPAHLDMTHVKGMCFHPDGYIIITSSNSKIACVDADLVYQSYAPIASGCNNAPCISSNGKLFVRSSNYLYGFSLSSGILTQDWSNSSLISGTHGASPILDANENLITCSNSNVNNNIHIFDTSGSLIDILNLDTLVKVNATPSIDSKQILYMISNQGSYNFIYAYGTGTSPTTTTTSTTPTTTTTTTGTGTTSTTSTTSTTTPTITTTTTTPAPISEIITENYEIINDKIVFINSSSAGNSQTTKDTPFANSLSFGTIAPGETSKTIIIGLNVKNAPLIKNIKLGLINTGDIEFANNIFGYATSSVLRTDLAPTEYFQGVSDNTETSIYNINIDNRSNTESNYIYLNISLPLDHTLATGIIKLAWFFEYYS